MKQGVFMAVVITGMGLGTGAVQASDDGLGLGIGVHASTLGNGIELGKSFSDYFSLRLGLNRYTYRDTKEIDNIDYKTDLDFNSSALMLDWNPFGGTFHLTAGYLNSSNTLAGSATPIAGSTVTIGSTDYYVNNTGDIVLDSDISLGSGPYIGLGWGRVPASGFGFTFDVGVVQMGQSDVSLDLSGNDSTNIAVLKASGDVDAEIKRMKKDLNEFDTYPVIAIGISYGF